MSDRIEWRDVQHWHDRAVAAERERDALRDALSEILTICEDANRAWQRLDVAGIARRAVLAGEAAPPPGKTGEANLGASTARSSEGKVLSGSDGRCWSVAPDAVTACLREHGHGGTHQHGGLYWHDSTTDDSPQESSPKSVSRGAPLSAQTEGARETEQGGSA